MREVVAEAQASSANLGSGFDTFAVALGRPADRLRVSGADAKLLEVEIRVPRRSGLSQDPKENVAGVVASAISKAFKLRKRIKITIERKVPAGLGMGSSAASAAACAVAMNDLFGLGLSKEEMVSWAGKGEAASSGTAHYDNVSAAIYGGFVVVRSGRTPSVVRFDPPRALRLCVATPLLRLPERKTKYARSILPKKIELRQMVSNLGSAGTLVAGFAKGDIALIGAGMHDEVVEPARSTMIPGYGRVRKEAMEAGASGVCISGAGPSMLAVVDVQQSRPREVLAAMLGGFTKSGSKAEGFVTKTGEGARVVASS